MNRSRPALCARSSRTRTAIRGNQGRLPPICATPNALYTHGRCDRAPSFQQNSTLHGPVHAPWLWTKDFIDRLPSGTSYHEQR